MNNIFADTHSPIFDLSIKAPPPRKKYIRNKSIETRFIHPLQPLPTNLLLHNHTNTHFSS
jgi:hypothetical protein